MTPARTPEELDALVERLGLIAAWHKPGGPTPKHPMPSRTKTCTQAAATITDLRARIAALEAANSIGTRDECHVER